MNTTERNVGGSDGARARGWWAQYCHPINGDPATRAQLRRCRTDAEVLTVPGGLALAERLGALGRAPVPDERLRMVLRLARVLAHVKEYNDRHPMRAVGWGGVPGDRKESDAGDKRPKLAEARFRRLLQVERGEEQVSAFARLIAQMGDKVNVTTLARDFLRWDDATKERWAFEYYAAGSAAPRSDNNSEDGQ